MGERLVFVDPHHDRVQGRGITAGVDKLEVMPDSLDSAMAEVVEEGLRALVQASEERPSSCDQGPHAVVTEGRA